MIKIETKREITVTLELTLDEAIALKFVLNRCAGSFEKSYRKETANVNLKLESDLNLDLAPSPHTVFEGSEWDGLVFANLPEGEKDRIRGLVEKEILND